MPKRTILLLILVVAQQGMMGAGWGKFPISSAELQNVKDMADISVLKILEGWGKKYQSSRDLRTF